uniref:Phosphatidate cytidylyltransferase n=1 Tax=Caenorhabditis tropicalis TaxID=1561998 RepID=A0A1I7UCF3_9PELO
MRTLTLLKVGIVFGAIGGAFGAIFRVITTFWIKTRYNEIASLHTTIKWILLAYYVIFVIKPGYGFAITYGSPPGSSLLMTVLCPFVLLLVTFLYFPEETKKYRMLYLEIYIYLSFFLFDFYVIYTDNVALVLDPEHPKNQERLKLLHSVLIA